MRRITLVTIGAMMFLFGGCASQPETPQTEVDGPVVSEGHYEDREFTEDEIDSFARAYLEVTAIQQQYQAEIERTESPEERQRLSHESTVESEAAMQEHGIVPETYNEIALRLPDDDDLRARVHETIRDIEEERIEETQRQLEQE